MWIFGGFLKDFLVLVLPGLSALLLMPLALHFQMIGFIEALGVLAFVFADAGHVYTTLWRTYLAKEERQRRPWYFWLPIGLFGLFFIWADRGWPWLWPFVLYATVFHNIRQFYGISKWYQKLNNSFSPVSDYFLYALCGLPVLIFHFRPLDLNSYYALAAITLFPNALLLSLLQKTYLMVAAGWIAFEFYRWQKYSLEINRFFSILLPAAIYGVGFILGRTLEQAIFPLVLAHGLAYIFLLPQSMIRTQAFWKSKQLYATLAVLLTAAVAGFLHDALEGDIWGVTASTRSQAFLIAIVLTPLFFHYIVDAIIWRRRHPDAALIYTS